MPDMKSSLLAPPIALLDFRRSRASRIARQRKLAGPVLGARYSLVRPLGPVGPLTIYEAEDVDNGGTVAIRLLAEPKPEPESESERGALDRRYLVETRVAITLRHPNIVEVLDFGRDIHGDGEPVSYLVLEYLEGEHLGATLAIDGPLRWTQVLTITKQICLALREAHAHQIVHCNINPATCFRVLRDGQPDLIKVSDFGDASFACKRTGRCTPEPRSAEPGSIAPELLAGESFDGRVDIYALGLLMYRLITNRMPYPHLRAVASDMNPDELTLGRTVPVPMRKALPSLEVSAAFEKVVLKALALDPEQRYANPNALYDALVAAEQASSRPSRLANDPLRWDPDERREASRPPAVGTAPLAALAPTELSSPRWPPAPSWTALIMRATLALMVTTVVVRTALTLLP